MIDFILGMICGANITVFFVYLLLMGVENDISDYLVDRRV
jgi:hypothetical protein